jgi:predicted NBD/HSP70 family sugar kinase
MENLWGIDLGGTKVEGVILKSSNSTEVLFRDRIATEAHLGYSHMVGRIARLVDIMSTHAGYRPERIGIGTPGTLDPRLGVMKNCNTTALNNQPLKKDLETALSMNVRMANDANCFALAETRLGVVKERFPQARVVFGVIMGTGVGGGIVLEGRAWNGLQGIAGEWGHNFLDESGGPCYCGKSGCIEKVLAGPALEKYYEQISGRKKSLKEIVAESASGDSFAAKTMERLSFFFGKAISALINTLDPDVIVVGGGVGNIDEIYSAGVDSLRKHIFNNRVDTPIVKPRLGDSAGVFGAAFLTDDIR